MRACTARTACTTRGARFVRTQSRLRSFIFSLTSNPTCLAAVLPFCPFPPPPLPFLPFPALPLPFPSSSPSLPFLCPALFPARALHGRR